MNRKQIAEAEARGYARGVDASVALADRLSREWAGTDLDRALAAARLANEIRALLLKPKGEAVARARV